MHAAVRVRLEGLPGGVNPRYITVHEVPFTDTRSGVPVAAALPIVLEQEGSYSIRIPPGLTRQVWLSLHPQDAAPGDYRGQVRVDHGGSRASIALQLRIHPIRFPDRPALHLGGWDYTDRERSYEVTPENRAAVIRHLREHHVDSPWAQSAVLDRGQYDGEGRMTTPPNPAQFRTWLDRWPDARNYYVFASVDPSFAGFRMGTPAFERAVAEWITWWVNQLKAWKVEPGKLG